MEIEVKAKLDNKKELLARLAQLSVQKIKEKHQIDEYYDHPSKDLTKTNEYIRLRQIPGEKKAIFAHHINISNGVNDEYEVEVADADVFRSILKNFGFNLLGTIDKKREVYNLDPYTITIDDVKDIDVFVEVEVEGSKEQAEQKREECKKTLQKLGIDESQIREDVWLADIATKRVEYDG